MKLTDNLVIVTCRPEAWRSRTWLIVIKVMSSQMAHLNPNCSNARGIGEDTPAGDGQHGVHAWL